MRKNLFLIVSVFACLCMSAQTNLSRHHSFFQSSSYDHNLTCQLLGDGIITNRMPAFLVTKVNGKEVERREREWAIDGNEYSNHLLVGSTVSLIHEWHDMSIKVDSIELRATVAYDPEVATRGFDIFFRSGEEVIARQSQNGLPGKKLSHEVQADPNKQADKSTLPACEIREGYKLRVSQPIECLTLHMNMPGAAYWNVSELKFFYQGEEVTEVLPSFAFTSAWMPKSKDNEWVYVDLGDYYTISSVKPHWIVEAEEYEVNLSPALPTGEGVRKDTFNNLTEDSIRYVTLYIKHSSQLPILSELEVIGQPTTTPLQSTANKTSSINKTISSSPSLVGRAGERLLLTRADGVLTGEAISQPDFQMSEQWIPATVPSTVLMSYVKAGAVPDPNYDDNIELASESFFNSNFFYRHEFNVDALLPGKHIFLNTEGINWKASFWVNGTKVGRTEGAFIRGRIDVTPYIHAGENILVIEVERVAHPGAVKEKSAENTDFNGGILGYDNPTFHATIGWDWITTVRGRDIGIWNDLFFTEEDAVTLRDPYVTTHIDNGASMTAGVVAINNTTSSITTEISGFIGDIRYSKQVKLLPGENNVVFSSEDYPQLAHQDMQLWWPNGYGDPYLYDAGFATNGAKIDFKAGIREVTYTDTLSALRIYINGKRFIPLGGNWGFPEHNLEYRQKEYDTAVRYHRDMNFNMIRNWVGQTGDEEFYEACDRYGIMVWQDFWLANPVDGPNPKDEQMFLQNALNYVKRIRRYPSIGLYCGRNEGYPPAGIDAGLRQICATQHPGILYISSSADDGVSGHGPYWALPAKEYFARQTGKLHSERGMPNVMTYSSLCKTLAPEHLWPQNEYWGKHDYVLAGAQRGRTFNKIILDRYGEAESAEDFCDKAQWVNYDGYRAMYEAGSHDRMGLLIWMSHACWPSMTWQCYDYYFVPTAAYFGCKKACEPLHIQYNALTGKIEVVNICAGEHRGITAKCDMYDETGKKLLSKTEKLDIFDDETNVLNLSSALPTGEAPFLLRLTLLEGKHVLSTNDYILADKVETHLAKQVADITVVEEGETDTVVDVKISNDYKDHLMLLNEVKLQDADGNDIAPVLYSDNYFHLLPGESKTVRCTIPTDSAKKSIKASVQQHHLGD